MERTARNSERRDRTLCPDRGCCSEAVDPLWGLLDMTPEGRGEFFPKVKLRLSTGKLPRIFWHISPKGVWT